MFKYTEVACCLIETTSYSAVVMNGNISLQLLTVAAIRS